MKQFDITTDAIAEVFANTKSERSAEMLLALIRIVQEAIPVAGLGCNEHGHGPLCDAYADFFHAYESAINSPDDGSIPVPHKTGLVN